jgi:alpha-acetolactate decarboxylase
MKHFSVLVAGLLALGLVACGGGDSSSETSTQEAAAASAKVEELKLEKEKAEAEVESVKVKAEQEALRAKVQARKTARKAAAKERARAQVQEDEPEEEVETAEVPNVIGMRLPQAQSALKAAGYQVRAENTDTTFGIVVPSHYTICEQSEPQGTIVNVLAQKYGC